MQNMSKENYTEDNGGDLRQLILLQQQQQKKKKFLTSGNFPRGHFKHFWKLLQAIPSDNDHKHIKIPGV